MKGLRTKQLEQAMKVFHQPKLTADELDKLGWNVSEDPDFLSEMESAVYCAASPRVTFSKDDMRRILQPAVNDARTLYYRLGSPDSFFPNLNEHADFLKMLLAFIEDVDGRLEELASRPAQTRPKHELSREVVQRILASFNAHGIDANTYEKGPFCTAVRVVFSAANRLNPGCMPRTTKSLVLEALSEKK